MLATQNQERGGQRELLAVDGDLPLLHGFQQGGLSAGNGTVDLVRQQEIGHYRPLAQLKIPGFLIVYPHTDDIAGQQIRDKLDSSRLTAQGDGDGLNQGGLSHAGQIIQQDMSIGQNRHHDQSDPVRFSYDDLFCFFLDVL